MSPLTGVLREAWATYKAYAGHFLLIAFVLYLIAAIITALLTFAAGNIGAGVGWFISLFLMFLLQAALVKAVQDVRDRRVDLDLRGTLSAALPYVLPVAAASILAAIGIVIGFALIIVPGLILLTFWSLIVPCIVLGGSSPLESFRQSWRIQKMPVVSSPWPRPPRTAEPRGHRRDPGQAGPVRKTLA